MKNVALPRLVKWMFTTGLVYLLCMVLMRLLFFKHFAVAPYSFSNCAKSFLLGLQFDARIVCGIVLFPFLIGSLHLYHNNRQKLTLPGILQVFIVLLVMVLLIIFMKKGHAPFSFLLCTGILFLLILSWLFTAKNCNPFENAVSQRIFKVYFFIITIIMALLYAIDFEHFDYLHQRLNASALNYLEDAKISMNMVWQTYPVIKLLLLVIISVVLIFWIFNRSFNRLKNSSHTIYGTKNFIVGLVFTLLLAVGIFGRISQYPLRWSDAFAFDDDFKANLSLNPVQSFLSTLQFIHSTYDIKKVRADYPLIATQLKINNADSTSLSYKRFFDAVPFENKPNVIVVICESFSAYKSSMWGNPLNTTPFFNEMCKQGIFFDRCFTPAYGTARGVWAVITGIPDVEYPNTASRNPGAVDEHSIISDYDGYEKYYFIGGSASWANIRGLLTNNIQGLHLYEEENYTSKPVDVWGISDKRLFLEANDVFKKQTKPFIAVIQTADNHRPYTIPGEDRGNFQVKKYATDSLKKFGFQSNDEINAFRYTDFGYQTFIEAAKKESYFNNTIFVFVGDHGIRGDAGNMFPQVWDIDGLTTQHVPLLFYAPALLSPQRIDRTCSQIDLLPSASALAHVRYTNTTLGRNLFDTSAAGGSRFRNAAFLFDPTIKQIGMVTDQYCYVHNLISGSEDFRSAINNNPLPETAQIAEDKKEIIDLTNAYYETARYMMLNNQKRNIRK